MKWQLSPDVYKLLKKLDVRVRNSFWKQLEVFKRDPNDPTLGNKLLKRNLVGFGKIDIKTKDDKYVAIYEIIDEETAYFVQVGLKEELYSEENKI